jgi:hypothetical protein
MRPARAAGCPMLVKSADDLGVLIGVRRHTQSLSVQRLCDVTGLDRRVLKGIENGDDDAVELRVVLLVVNALGMDVELRPRDAPFVPVLPSRVDELGLSAATLAALSGAGIREVADVPSGDVLLGYSEFASGAEAWEVVCALNRHGMTTPVRRRHGLPSDREREMFRLRVVEGLTLRAIGDRYGVIGERVRQLLAAYFGLRGVPPAAKGKRRRPRDAS